MTQLYPSAASADGQRIGRFHEDLEDNDDEEIRAEIRQRVSRMDTYLFEGLDRFDLQVLGSLGVLLGLSEGQTSESPTALCGGAFWCFGCGSRI